MTEPAIHEPVYPQAELGAAGMLGALPSVAEPPQAPPPQATGAVAGGIESRRARFIRMAHRTRLHLYALVAVALLVYVVALATSNTRGVRVDWVFASSTVPLVWLTLFAAILGWLLGILITILFRLRTRAAPQPSAAADTTTSSSPG